MKRPVPPSFNDGVIKATQDNVVLNVHLQLGPSAIRNMTPDLLAHEIIKNNIQKFRRMMLLNKEMRHVIEGIPNLYQNLFKYIFPNYYVAFYEWMRISNEGFIKYANKFIRFNREIIGDDDEDDIETLLHMFGMHRFSRINNRHLFGMKTSDIQKTKHDKFFYDNPSLFKWCREDIHYASHINRLFAFCTPFGIPHATYYMTRHARLRRIMMKLVRHMVCELMRNVSDTSDELYSEKPYFILADEVTVAQERNIHELGKHSYEMVNKTKDCITMNAEWVLGIMTSSKMTKMSKDDEILSTYIKKKTIPQLEKLIAEKDEPDEYYFTQVGMHDFIDEADKVLGKDEDSIAHTNESKCDKIRYQLDLIKTVTFGEENEDRVALIERLLNETSEATGFPSWYASTKDDKNRDALFRRLFYRALSIESGKDLLTREYYTMQSMMTLCHVCPNEALLQETGNDPRFFCSKECQELSHNEKSLVL